MIVVITSIDDLVIDERFVRASGPGGQNVNKVATAVELRVNIASSSLTLAVKARLATLAGGRITSEGVLIIDSREHRTQARNREAARERLREFGATAAAGEWYVRDQTPSTRVRVSSRAGEVTGGLSRMFTGEHSGHVRWPILIRSWRPRFPLPIIPSAQR